MDDIAEKKKKDSGKKKGECAVEKNICNVIYIARVFYTSYSFFHHQNAIFVLFYRFKKQDTFKIRIKIANVTYLEYDNFLISYYKNSVLQT